MADKDLLANIGAGGGLTWKRVAIIGGSGGIFIGATDYWVDQWFEEETDTKSQQRMRALSQAALGLGVAYLVKRWNRDVALGVAVGGVVGAGVRLWESEDMASKMDEWFGDDANTSQQGQQGNQRTGGAPAIPAGERIVFTGPPQRMRVVA